MTKVLDASVKVSGVPTVAAAITDAEPAAAGRVATLKFTCDADDGLPLSLQAERVAAATTAAATKTERGMTVLHECGKQVSTPSWATGMPIGNNHAIDYSRTTYTATGDLRKPRACIVATKAVTWRYSDWPGVD
jgi:hypothetical protein